MKSKNYFYLAIQKPKGYHFFTEMKIYLFAFLRSNEMTKYIKFAKQIKCFEEKKNKIFIWLFKT